MSYIFLISILLICGFTSTNGSPFGYDSRKLGDKCTQPTDCDLIPNAECKTGTCQCKDTFITDKDKCFPGIVDGVCKNTDDCVKIPNTECTMGQCKCKNGYAPANENKHCELRKLGDVCYSEKDCGGIGNATCVNKMCKCEKGYIGENNTITCEEGKLNSTCTSNDDCFLIGHAECNRNLCMCAPGFETDGRTCTMDNSSFCFDGSDCRNNLTHWCNETTGLCSCRVGYEGLGDDCVAPLNKPCTPEEGCIDPDAECVDFRCNCRSGLVAEGGRCVSHHGTHIHLKARGNGEISVELDIEED